MQHKYCRRSADRFNMHFCAYYEYYNLIKLISLEQSIGRKVRPSEDEDLKS